MIPGTQRRLVLLRHAKSSRPHGVPDHDRPLAGKGRRNAHATGEWFVDEGPRPDLALVSTAVRARQTWELVCRAGIKADLDDVRVEYDERVYGADLAELLLVLAAVADGVRTLVVVGHEPTMSETALTLAGHGSDRRALATLSRKFPTSAVAVLRFTGSWRSLPPGGAVLETFVVPRG